MDDERSVYNSIVKPELYFLISKFLTAGPLQDTARVLIKELEDKKILPKRIDWTGNEHDQTFAELERKYPHIGPNHLLETCYRIGPILDKELIPSVSGVISLLGSGRQSLLRTKESICRPRNLVDYCTRLHGMSLPDSVNCKPTHNLAKVLIGRETGGRIRRSLLIPTGFYRKTRLLRRTLGHLSAVYCVLFDRSGRYIITGADDLLVKVWSAIDGRLLITIRGASAEITDIAINIDNTMLAAGSLDRILRVWDLQTAAPIAILQGHTGMITSVNFCPSPRSALKYLVTTSTDGSVAFWQYLTPRGGKPVFAPKPIQYHEKLRPGQAQMLCASFSPGGIFLATGSADHHVRVYIMQEDGPKRILETESHTEAVDSIQWAHRGLRFVSGSKEGIAQVWSFESQQWKSLKLNMSERLPSCPEPEDDSKKLKVTMVAWDYSDKWVITAVNDCTIKIWDSRTGRLHKVLRGHKDELYVLESHPKDEHVLLSAGHDGQLFLWDIVNGVHVAHFNNNIDGQGHGGVFDAKFSPDGTMIAATDSHGHILLFGFGAGHERFNILPTELFFHTDYRPLIRDGNHIVVDEQTQMLPHLMPPPFLVDIDGNPHPPTLQRLVPGRENCPTDQLIPNIAVGPDGVEVVDSGSLSHIDRLIEALAHRHGQDQAPDSINDRENWNQNNSRINNSPRSNANGARVGLRRTGDVEGVRQSSGNWQRETSFKWIRRIYVRPMKYAQLQAIKQVVYSAGLEEQEIYKREMRRRPIIITTGHANLTSQSSSGRSRGTRNARRAPRPAYRTRAVREREHVEQIPQEDDEEEEEDSASNSSVESSYSTAVNEEMLSSSSTSDSESSDYSDWVADKPGPNLEPPKRSKRKPVERRAFSPSSDNSQTGVRNGDKKKMLVGHESGEIPDSFRPPEWLSEVIPRKAPYYPQMGDEIVYFRQGHQQYLEAVRAKKVYKLTNSSEPWNSLELRDHEIVRVIGIKYEIRPPRLCCLKLALINKNGQMTGPTFTIKYHDMPDVLDFLVLRQTFDTAVVRNWSPGDRFRCMIEDGWWMGQIESRLALSVDFPDSLFMCFRVRWDNGEYENMSPWDMEPIDENRLPAEIGGAVPVLPEEIRATLYQPKPEEWPRGDRDASCRRIISGLEQVIGLAIADPFLVPVDLNVYPAYAFVVEYPIDLTTIKARFENHFYRRITSAQFDVRYLATNAEKFNRSHSNIVKHARIVTDLCLRIIRDPNDVDVGPLYHQLVATYISSDSESENPNEPGPSTSTSRARRNPTTSRRSKRLRSETDWRLDCRELLDMIWQCDDSTPFREPVDTLEHPDYLQIVDSPMDLRTIKEDLIGGNYESPMDFAKDMRLIFQNSKNYNTNKRSRIYSMTLRLSTLFETHIKQVMLNWRRSKSKTKSNKPSRSRPGTSKMATRAGTSNCNGTTSRNANNSDSDEEDDDNDDQNDGRCSKTRNRNNRLPRKRIATSTNGVSSTQSSSVLPGPSGRSSRRNASLPNSQEEEDTDSSSSSSSSDSSNDDTDESRGIPVSDLGSSNRTRKSVKNRGQDSEDSYKPNGPLTKKKKKSTKKRKSIRKENLPNDRNSKRKSRIAQSEDDIENDDNDGNDNNDDDDNDNDSDNNQHRNKRRRLAARKKDTSTENYNSESDNNSKVRKRRGRPTKSSESSRKTRQNGDEDEIACSEQTNTLRSRNNRRGETDHSYHMPPKTGRRFIVESDTEHEVSRPTRSSVRRANLEWARGDEDSLEDNHDDEENDNTTRKPAQSRPGKRKKTSESEPSPDDSTIVVATSSRRNPPFRQVRTNRNTRVLPPDESEDDRETSMNQQSTNNANQRSRTTRNINDYQNQSHSASAIAQILRDEHQHDHQQQRRQQHQQQRQQHTYTSRQSNATDTNGSNALAGRRMTTVTTPTPPSSTVTRSHANSTTNSDSVPSSSTTATTLRSHSFRSHVQNDHNYGEPGPSTMRHTRRMLSRHQRNADELDPLYNETDPLELPTSVVDNISSRLRIRNTVNSTSSSSARNGVTVSDRALRRGRNTRPRYSYDNEDDDDDDAGEGNDDEGDELENDDDNLDDDDVEGEVNGENSDDKEDNQNINSEEQSDSEDDQPLRQYMSTSSRTRVQHQPLRSRSRRYSDEDYEEANENDIDRRRLSGRSGGKSRLNGGGRNTRNQKRPYYNEESDESLEGQPNRKRRTGMRSSPSSPYRNSHRHHLHQHNHRNGHSNVNGSRNTNNDDNDDSDNDQTISISSRGRVRKITAKARGLFRD